MAVFLQVRWTPMVSLRFVAGPNSGFSVIVCSRSDLTTRMDPRLSRLEQ